MSYPELSQIFSILSPEIRDQSQEIFYRISRFIAVEGWQVWTKCKETLCCSIEKGPIILGPSLTSYFSFLKFIVYCLLAEVNDGETNMNYTGAT